MKYAIIDQTKGDWFDELFENEKAAISKADYEWINMTQHDRSRREAYFVAACEVDEEGCIIWDSVRSVKEYL